MFHTFHSEARLIAFNEGFSPKEGADDAKLKQLETRASAGLQRDKSTKREKDPSVMREEGVAATKAEEKLNAYIREGKEIENEGQMDKLADTVIKQLRASGQNEFL